MLRDFRIKRRIKHILFENVTHLVRKTAVVDDIRVRGVGRKTKRQPRKGKKNAAKKKRKSPAPLNKPLKVVQREPPEQLNPITNPVPETTTISIEEKTVSINEWLELSSKVQLANDLDITEFLQFPSLFIISDIVSFFFFQSILLVIR